jgi:spoIIIJ-associated protein
MSTTEGTGDPIGALERAVVAVVTGMGIEASVRIEEQEDGSVRAVVEGGEAEELVGRGGETLDALQYLGSQIVARAEGGRGRMVTVDAADYRRKREESLTKLAGRAADEAVEHGEEIELDVMTPQDRRIVHLALKEREDVVTRSEGEEPRRRIIVEPAD